MGSHLARLRREGSHDMPDDKPTLEVDP